MFEPLTFDCIYSLFYLNKFCLSNGLFPQICTLLTQRAMEDIKRCKDPAAIASGMSVNPIRAYQKCS